MLADASTFLYALADISTTLGCIFLGIYVMPLTRLKLRITKVGGVGFFVLSALVHFGQALRTLFRPGRTYGEASYQPATVIVHVALAVCLWLFICGLYIELVRWAPWGRDKH